MFILLFSTPLAPLNVVALNFMLPEKSICIETFATDSFICLEKTNVTKKILLCVLISMSKSEVSVCIRLAFK